VRLRLSHGKVTGVYALCAAQIALSSEERAQLGGVHYCTQPAIGRIRWGNQDFESTHEPLVDQAMVRPRPGHPLRAQRQLLTPTRQPLRLPPLRRDPLRPLRTRLHRHVSTRQRRHLPLLRLHRPPEVRTQILSRRARPAREARDRPPAPTHQHLPRRPAHPRRPRRRSTADATRATRAR
jgi:hypothetical protein